MVDVVIGEQAKSTRRGRPVSFDVVQLAFADMAKRTGQKLRELQEQITALREENVALRMRVEQVEQKGFVDFVGVFKDGHAYRRGEIVSFRGSGWYCQRETTDRPGTSDAWVLFVKRGRDARMPRP